MSIENPHVELLAPAGNPTCLHAAVQAGADAVYLGLESFNARRGAGNFTLKTLREGCEYAHLRGVRIYLTLNTVIMDSELKAALECARQAWRAGVDAFIVQDLFGGEVYGILRPGGNYHCYNVIGEAKFDLTSEQFGEEAKDLVYDDKHLQSREVHFAKEEKKARYEYLKQLVYEYRK